VSEVRIAVSTQTQSAEGNLTKLEAKIERLELAMRDTGTASVKAAKDAEGSFAALEKELKQNEAALRKMALGTKEFDAQKVKVDQLRQSLVGAKGAMKGVSQEQSVIGQAGSSAISDIKNMALQFLTLQTIVSAISSELEHVSELKLKAAGTTRTLEGALADIGVNVGAENIEPARQMIEEEAPKLKLGVTQEGLANLLGTAISAGAKDLNEAMKVSAAALRVTVGDSTKAEALVGGMLDVASLGGSDNYEGALGQLMQLAGESRSTNFSQMVANMGPALAAATADGQNMEGATMERALEMSAVISQIIKDPTGANTGTAVRQLFSKTDSFAPEKEKTLADGSVSKLTKEEIDRYKNAKTFDDRMSVLQSNPELQKQFLGSIEESIGKVAIREIVTQSELAVGLENKAKGNITGIDEAQGEYTKLIAGIQKQTTHLTAERNVAAILQKGDTTGGRATAGQVEKIVQDTIDSVNLSGIDSETQGTIRNRLRLGEVRGDDPIETGITALEEAKDRRRAFGFLPVGGEVSEKDRQKIDEVISELKAMRASMVGPGPRVDVRVQQPAARPKAEPLPEKLQP
jgi:phosphotransferase system IIB component